MRSNSYQTMQKKLILDFLKENHDRMVNANDTLEYLIKQNQKIGLTTIYRYLNLLEAEGKLRVEVMKNTRYFQYILEDCKNHFHLKCEKCGKIEHFECEEMHTFCEHIGQKHGFMIDTKNAIGGICKNCQKKMKVKK